MLERSPASVTIVCLTSKFNEHCIIINLSPEYNENSSRQNDGNCLQLRGTVGLFHTNAYKKFSLGKRRVKG